MSSIEERVAVIETNYSNIDKLLVNNFKKMDDYFDKVFVWQDSHNKEHNRINHVLDTFENSLNSLQTSIKKKEEFETKIKVGRKIANWTILITTLSNILLLILNIYLLNSKELF